MATGSARTSPQRPPPQFEYSGEHDNGWYQVFRQGGEEYWVHGKHPIPLPTNVHYLRRADKGWEIHRSRTGSPLAEGIADRKTAQDLALYIKP